MLNRDTEWLIHSTGALCSTACELYVKCGGLKTFTSKNGGLQISADEKSTTGSVLKNDPNFGSYIETYAQ